MIVVGMTTASYRMTNDDMNWKAWITNAKAVKAAAADIGEDDVRYFAALEVDGRGRAPFEPLIEILSEVNGVTDQTPDDQLPWWLWSLNDGVKVLTTGTRLRRIVAGHNLVGQYAVDNRASHCLFLASDAQARDDILPRLLELKAPVVASHITTYGLGRDIPGPDDDPASDARFGVPVQSRVEWHAETCPWPYRAGYLDMRDDVPPGVVIDTEHGDCTCGADQWDVRSHMETCAAMMLRRDAFIRIKWRVDPDRNMTDDPAMHADVTELLGIPVLSRHDVLATHWPNQIPAIEVRHTEQQRRVQW